MFNNFLTVCIDEDIDNMKVIKESNVLSNHEYYLAFEVSCISNKIKSVDQLLKFDIITLPCLESGFRMSLEKGNLFIAKMLYNTGRIDIRKLPFLESTMLQCEDDVLIWLRTL